MQNIIYRIGWGVLFATVLICLAFVSIFCWEIALPVTGLPSQLVYSTGNNRINRMYEKFIISAENTTYQKLDKILKEESDGWRIFVLPIPDGEHLFRGENLLIDCHADRVMIYFSKFGVHWSIEKRIHNLIEKLQVPACLSNSTLGCLPYEGSIQEKNDKDLFNAQNQEYQMGGERDKNEDK